MTQSKRKMQKHEHPIAFVLIGILCFLFFMLLMVGMKIEKDIINLQEIEQDEMIKPKLFCREGSKIVYETEDFVVCESKNNTAYISTTINYAKKMVENGKKQHDTKE